MDDRLCEAIGLVTDRLSEKQLEDIKKVLEIYEEVNNGYMDYNDWEEWYEDESEDGLEAYVCSVFGIEYTPPEDEDDEEEE